MTQRQRSTRQRATIAETLRRAPGFLSAQELHDRIREGGASVGLTTVYRTLQLMTDRGEIDSLRREDGESIYRWCGTDEHHHHLVCRSCGYSVEIADEDVEAWAAGTARKHGFKDVSHDMELFGLCRSCS